ncbi:unnamed protein product [Ambrosiozyma monospora]|uniref:Unnamed protein product n=1 Tax=Ambrosiozyma monospora TaxID=43982 RepID=A0ACB5SV93_AMBMO|nr:unnamed protein product [Ambrosiozyma monospora]
MLSFFGSSTKQFSPDQFEKDLKHLSHRITSTEKRIVSLRANKSYYSKVLPVYISCFYLLFVSYVYFIKHNRWTNNHILVAVLSPALSFSTYYLLLYTLNYLISTNDLRLNALKDQHKEKLDELKEQTNFYKTNELLTRFSNGEDFKELELQAREIEKKKQEYLKLIKEGKLPNPSKLAAANGDSSDGGNKIYDGFLKFMLGEDELSPDARYALICCNCFQHNGLAPPNVLPQKVKYICPKCGFLNGNEEEKKEKEKAPVVEGKEKSNSVAKISDKKSIDKPEIQVTDNDLDEIDDTTERTASGSESEKPVVVTEKTRKKKRSHKKQ